MIFFSSEAAWTDGFKRTISRVPRGHGFYSRLFLAT